MPVVKVLFFARGRELAGTAEAQMSVGEGAGVRVVLRAVRRHSDAPA